MTADEPRSIAGALDEEERELLFHAIVRHALWLKGMPDGQTKIIRLRGVFRKLGL